MLWAECTVEQALTHIEAINDDFVDSIRICCNCSGNLAPVSQPHIFSLVDQSRVIIQLVVQDHIEAVASKQADDEDVAVQSGGLTIKVVTADAFCDRWRVLHRHMDI